MCGINGMFAYRNETEPPARDSIIAVRDHMSARGPDDAGLWVSHDTRVGLGHRRLSIIGLGAGGNQPMFDEDRSLVVVFNGEIYNYRKLRHDLQRDGAVFRTNTDTEVLLQLYKHDGYAMLQHLRGMFAFAIWDLRKRSLFLARDPFGMKPLYYSDQQGMFRFASQVKALRSDPTLVTTPDPAGACGFFMLGSVPEPYTLYREIRSLPAGAFMVVEEDKLPWQRCYCSISDVFREGGELDLESQTVDRREYLAALLTDSVAHHLVADVPVGLFLSGGLDSAVLAQFASEQCRLPVRSFTIGFKEFEGTINDEVPGAEQVAAQYKTQHITKRITGDEFSATLEPLLKAMDQPSIDGVNTYLVSRIAAQAGLKVVLSGIGGDELFAGYPSFTQVPLIVAILSRVPFGRRLGGPLRELAAPLLKRLSSPKYASLLEYGRSYEGAYFLRRGLFMPWELHHVLDPDLVRTGCEELERYLLREHSVGTIPGAMEKVGALECSLYMRNQLLRDADWAGMSHSLEIRTPFVDLVLLNRILADRKRRRHYTKADLRSLLARPVQDRLKSRPKTGFVVPVQQWLRTMAIREGEYRGLRGWALTVYEYFLNDKGRLPKSAVQIECAGPAPQ